MHCLPLAKESVLFLSILQLMFYCGRVGEFTIYDLEE